MSFQSASYARNATSASRFGNHWMNGSAPTTRSPAATGSPRSMGPSRYGPRGPGAHARFDCHRGRRARCARQRRRLAGTGRQGRAGAAAPVPQARRQGARLSRRPGLRSIGRRAGRGLPGAPAPLIAGRGVARRSLRRHPPVAAPAHDPRARNPARPSDARPWRTRSAVTTPGAGTSWRSPRAHHRRRPARHRLRGASRIRTHAGAASRARRPCHRAGAAGARPIPTGPDRGWTAAPGRPGSLARSRCPHRFDLVLRAESSCSSGCQPLDQGRHVGEGWPTVRCRRTRFAQDALPW